MEIYSSNYWDISYYKEKSLINPKWNESSFEMLAEEYKFEMEEYTQLVEKHQPSKALIDCLAFGFTITVELQEWINNTLFPRIIASGVRRVAILLPDEIIAQLSLEQVMEESNGVKFETNYFSVEMEAENWLLK